MSEEPAKYEVNRDDNTQRLAFAIWNFKASEGHSWPDIIRIEMDRDEAFQAVSLLIEMLAAEGQREIVLNLGGKIELGQG